MNNEWNELNLKWFERTQKKKKKTTTQGEGENDVVDAGDAPAWNAEKKKKKWRAIENQVET